MKYIYLVTDSYRVPFEAFPSLERAVDYAFALGHGELEDGTTPTGIKDAVRKDAVWVSRTAGIGICQMIIR